MIIETIDDCQLPDHLNQEFLQTLLINRIGHKSCDLLAAKFSIGSKPGDNFLSSIYRVEVIYTGNTSSIQKTSFIIKVIVESELAKSFAEINIFQKEKIIYFDILPRMEVLLGETKISPICYQAIDEPNKTLVFEDMKAVDYRMADRMHGLDEAHCRIALAKLAKFHAASLLLIKQQIKSERLASYFHQNLILLIDDMSKSVEYGKLVKKLRGFSEINFFDKIIAALNSSSDDVIVLNHGDFWLNNILFKYDVDDCSPIDSILIDFQGSTFGSLGLDLNYFQATSLKLNVMETRINDLIEHSYYATLRETLESAAYENILSLEDVRKEIRKKEICGFFYGMAVLPIITVSMQESLRNPAGTAVVDGIGKSNRFLDTMKCLTKIYDDHGVFCL